MGRFLFAATMFAVLLTLSPVDVTAADAVQKQKAILVTGASTGIGRKITEVLAANGYFVYAGARKQKDLDALNDIENVQSIRLDVTVQEEIDDAVEFVRAEGRGLHGLVNNAGVAILGPLVEVDVEETQWLFDVNVFGPYRITQAFAPLIIEDKGRITTIGSISGILSGTYFGSYSMSKHAIEAYTDSLAKEMQRFDVKVSVVEPGNYESKIGDSARKRMAVKKYLQEGSPYAEDMQRALASRADRPPGAEPDAVAAAVMHALFDDKPKHRYMVVPKQEEARYTIAKVIEELVQLNEGHEYSYSQEELVSMLNDAMTN